MTAQALAFDEETVKLVITNLQGLKINCRTCWQIACLILQALTEPLKALKDYEAAQDCIKTDEKRDAFAKDFNSFSKLWEALSPDDVLNKYQKDYKWLSQVYLSVKPSSDDNGRLLWHALGAQTTINSRACACGWHQSRHGRIGAGCQSD